MAIRHVDRPTLSPTRCVVCWQNQHPDGFVDFGVEVPEAGFDETGRGKVRTGDVVALEGHLYVCAGCVQQAAVQVGCLDPAGRQRVDEQLAEAADELAELADRLEQAKADRVISLDDALTLLAPAQKTAARPKAQAS